jgi:hypothetical protein
VYGDLDPWVSSFEHAKLEGSVVWLTAAEGLIRRLEASYATAEVHRSTVASPSRSEPAEPAPIRSDTLVPPPEEFDEQDTAVFRPTLEERRPSTERYG